MEQSVNGRVAGSATTEERPRMKVKPTVASRHFNRMLFGCELEVEFTATCPEVS